MLRLLVKNEVWSVSHDSENVNRCELYMFGNEEDARDKLTEIRMKLIKEATRAGESIKQLQAAKLYIFNKNISKSRKDCYWFSGQCMVDGYDHRIIVQQHIVPMEIYLWSCLWYRAYC